MYPFNEKCKVMHVVNVDNLVKLLCLEFELKIFFTFIPVNCEYAYTKKGGVDWNPNTK